MEIVPLSENHANISVYLLSITLIKNIDADLGSDRDMHEINKIFFLFNNSFIAIETLIKIHLDSKKNTFLLMH